MCMAKVQLLQHLARRSYVRLAPSPIAGVGVFALREIPARTDPFQGPNAHLRLPETVVSVTQSELDELEPAVRTHVLSMFGTLDDPRPRGGPLRERAAAGLRCVVAAEPAQLQAVLQARWRTSLRPPPAPLLCPAQRARSPRPARPPRAHRLDRPHRPRHHCRPRPLHFP